MMTKPYRFSKYLHVCSVFLLSSLFALLNPRLATAELINDPSSSDDGAPVFDIWYGNEQSFGHNGIAQMWINILGNVSDPDGVASLHYRLNNNAERPLSMGPDGLRLAEQGDFNVDIHITRLNEGLNEVVITAEDALGNRSQEMVSIQYLTDFRTSDVTHIEWSTVENIQDVAWIVDGKWELTDEGLRTVEPSYDRLIAVGDLGWTDYEVLVPITLHDINATFADENTGATLNISLRWQGHRIWDDRQPAYGWWPLGGTGGIRFLQNGQEEIGLSGNRAWDMDADSLITEIEAEVPYNFKLRVNTLPGNYSSYSFKIWKQGEAEPMEWQYEGLQRMWDPIAGSFLIIAHYTDVTVGDITITQLQGLSPWEWFELLGPFLTQLPVILISLAGIYLSLNWRERLPQIWRLVLSACLLLLVNALVGTYLSAQLPFILQVRGWETRELGFLLASVEALKSLAVAVALALLGLAIYRWRGETRND